uniref:RNase_Zc3h12a domain-containing protein n=1 Tax=Anopheles christyi TaxID=43041 RepID=A0A182KFR2_9DIPT
MAVHSRKPSVRESSKPYGRNKINRSHRTAAKSPALKARPITAKRHRATSLQIRRSVPSSPFHHTRVAITDLDIPVDSRRLVLIDGENVAYNDITDEYIANRMYQAYQWFVANGHRAVVLCPEYLSRKLSGQTPYMQIEVITNIEDGHQNHSTNVPFERTVLQRADEDEAAIVSERSFSSSYGEYLDIVKNRVIGFSFFRESIFIPVDPYGRAGPWLREILRK